MSEGRMFTTAEDAMAFLQAGNATVTLVSKKTGARYTYRVRESEDGRVFFVSVMYGSDNEGDYVYIGVIRDGEFQWTKKSRVQKDDARFKAFDWAYAHLAAGKLPTALEVWHEGKCGQCGRKLTVPESIDRGIGPECWSKRGSEPVHKADKAVEDRRKRNTADAYAHKPKAADTVIANRKPSLLDMVAAYESKNAA